MADIISIILEDLNIHDIYSALLVNREWCRAAVPFYWRAPFSFSEKRSVSALKVYEMFLTLVTVQNSKPLFDYPSFIKELNYTNLLACKSNYRRVSQVESIFQMLTDRNVCLETFIMENTGTSNERVYGLWTTQRYASIFSTLIRVEIHTPFPKNNVMKLLAKNCTRLSHLDINLHDTSDERAKVSINYLKELISAQKRLLNLRLVFPGGPGDTLIKAFRSHLGFFQRLELVKWNFSGCDWNWLKNCPNLTEFAITSPHPNQIPDILGAAYETYRMKPSKNSKIMTEHWHLDKGDEDSSISKFYFHSGKPSIAYGGEPPTIIQPKLRRRTSDRSHSLLNAYIKLHNEIMCNYESNDYDSFDDFDYEEHYGMTLEQWYNCYD